MISTIDLCRLAILHRWIQFAWLFCGPKVNME
jgi:hypothetical protein